MKPVHTIISTLSLLLSITGLAENSKILEAQFNEDLTALIMSKLPKTKNDSTPPLFTKKQLESSISKSSQKSSSEKTSNLTTSAEEEEKLKRNEHIITKEQFIKSIEELKTLNGKSPLPNLIERYVEIEHSAGLNPAQRLLAYRMTQANITRAKLSE